jgi:hypothetical protein
MGTTETEQELYGGSGEVQERDPYGGPAGTDKFSMALLKTTCHAPCLFFVFVFFFFAAGFDFC